MGCGCNDRLPSRLPRLLRVRFEQTTKSSHPVDCHPGISWVRHAKLQIPLFHLCDTTPGVTHVLRAKLQTKESQACQADKFTNSGCSHKLHTTGRLHLFETPYQNPEACNFSCRACYEVKCNKDHIHDNYGQKLDRTYSCFDYTQLVVVRVTDT